MTQVQDIRTHNNATISGLSSVQQGFGASERTSERYSFIPTVRLIDTLAERGWAVRSAKETRSREAGLVGFQKHMLTFRNPDLSPVGDKDAVFPEIILTNSHDGFSSFNLMAGLFRLVCSNGLVVADAMFASMRIRHTGYTDDAVNESIDHILRFIPVVSNKIAEWQNISLDYQERLVLAHAAVSFKYADDMQRRNKIDLGRLVRPIRRNDSDGTLWQTYNTIQEKLVKGDRIEKEELRNSWSVQTYRKARGVNGISESIRLNKALWTLADGMAKIKKGEANAIPTPLV